MFHQTLPLDTPITFSNSFAPFSVNKFLLWILFPPQPIYSPLVYPTSTQWGRAWTGIDKQSNTTFPAFRYWYDQFEKLVVKRRDIIGGGAESIGAGITSEGIRRGRWRWGMLSRGYAVDICFFSVHDQPRRKVTSVVGRSVWILMLSVGVSRWWWAQAVKVICLDEINGTDCVYHFPCLSRGWWMMFRTRAVL